MMDALAFTAMVFVISLTGALAPGPLVFGSIVKGVDDRWAGVKVALGHAIMEVPLIIAIFLGLDALMNDDILIAIGIVGGILLIHMGADMYRHRREHGSNGESDKRGPFRLGLMASLSNPYTWLWWLTVGAALISQAVGFGIWMLPVFIVAHLSTDIIWDEMVSFSTFHSRSILSDAWMTRIIAGGGIALALFGIYFIVDALNGIIY